MDLTVPNIAALVRLTLQDPRQGARRVMALDLPIGGRWLALFLVATCSVIGSQLIILLMPAEQREVMATMTAGPMQTVLFQSALWAVIAGLIAAGGRMRGGTGTFPDALILMAWLQFIQLCLLFLVMLAAVVLPSMVILFAMVGFVMLMLWVLTNFVAELHGFRSLIAVFVGLVAGALAFAFVAATLLTLFVGSTPSGA